MFSIAIAEAIAKNDCIWRIYFLAMAFVAYHRRIVIVATSAVTRRDTVLPVSARGYWRALAVRMWNHRFLYLMLVPPFLFFFLFRYYPMAGNVIAFKKFLPMQGIWGSPWVGLTHFESLFTDPVFLRVLRNTISIALLKLLITFPAPLCWPCFSMKSALCSTNACCKQSSMCPTFSRG